MARRFKLGSGKIVIWDGEGDTLPFDDPLAYADRVKFSTTFNYSRIIDKRTVSCTFPKADNGSEQIGTIDLFAHNRPGVPRVRGNVLVDGQNISMGCHIPIQTLYSNYLKLYSFRLATIGATETNVVVAWYANMLGFGDDSTKLPAFTIQITVEVFDELN